VAAQDEFSRSKRFLDYSFSHLHLPHLYRFKLLHGFKVCFMKGIFKFINLPSPQVAGL